MNRHFSAKRTPRVFALALTLMLLAGLLAGCGDTKNPEPRKPKDEITGTVTPEATETPALTDGLAPTDSPAPTDGPLPTDTPAPTEGPTATPTDTPTPSATPTPAAAFGTKAEDYAGIWYSKTIQGTEGEEQPCAGIPELDYTLDFYFEEGFDHVTLTHEIPFEDSYDEFGFGPESRFALKKAFDQDEIDLYRSWNYGVVDYLANPTDLSEGHLIYACTNTENDEVPKDALLIVDAQPDGTLRTELVYVLDNGSFPVFVTTTYAKPAVANGHIYNDYVGVWHMRSSAAYYEEGFYVETPGSNDMLIFNKDGSLDRVYLGIVRHEDGTVDDEPTYQTDHFRMCIDFTDEELAMYRQWDKDGIYVWGERQDGAAEETAKAGTDIPSGKLLYKNDDGFLLGITWNDTWGHYLGVDYIAHGSGGTDYDGNPIGDREYMTYFTYKRDFVREEGKEDPGCYYEDFIGMWNLKEFRFDGETSVTACDDPEKNTKLRISLNNTAQELYEGNVIANYALREEKSSSDPAWYADQNLQNVVTDLSKHRLVFRCTDTTGYPNALIVVDMNEDGTISTLYYGKNDAGVSYHPYRRYSLETGVMRRE